MQYLRKGLIVAALASLTLVTVRIANATTITDLGVAHGTMLPTPDDPTYTFKCCDGAKFAVDDLEVTYAANVTSATSTFPAADMCTGTFGGMMTTLTCKMINVGDIIVQTVTPAGATFVSACWTGETCITAANPIPEPASINVLAIGLLGLLGYGWHRRKAPRRAESQRIASEIFGGVFCRRVM